MILTIITFAIFAILCLFINEQLAQIRVSKIQIKYLQSSVENLNVLINRRARHINTPSLSALTQRLIRTTNENTRKIANLNVNVYRLAQLVDMVVPDKFAKFSDTVLEQIYRDMPQG